MSHFRPEFIKFFNQLSMNNSSTWFNENRKTYETHVKKPFEFFVADLIKAIQKVNPDVKIKPNEAITRINKDVRFSKEKIPYNTHVGAIISKYGRKSKEYPGIYIQISAKKVSIFSGAYMPEKENLLRIRQSIAHDITGFNKLINDKSFTTHFGQILGEKNKILPPESKALTAKQPLIANKSFHFYAELDSSKITSDNLIDLIIKYYKAAKPLNEFFIKAMKL